MIELPLLWVPGCVVLPGVSTDVVLRGRGRARAIWNAEEGTQGRLIVAPGPFPPRKASDLPAIVCEAGLRAGAPEGARRLFGWGRLRPIRVTRSGRGRVVECDNFPEPLADGLREETESLQAAWRQLERLRHARLPLSTIAEGASAELLAYLIASVLPSTVEQKLAVLAEMEPAARLERARALLQAEMDVALLERQILQVADD